MSLACPGRAGQEDQVVVKIVPGCFDLGGVSRFEMVHGLVERGCGVGFLFSHGWGFFKVNRL